MKKKCYSFLSGLLALITALSVCATAFVQAASQGEPMQTAACTVTAGCVLGDSHTGDCMTENSAVTPQTVTAWILSLPALENMMEADGDLTLGESGEDQENSAQWHKLKLEISAVRSAYNRLSSAEQALIDTDLLSKLQALEHFFGLDTTSAINEDNTDLENVIDHGTCGATNTDDVNWELIQNDDGEKCYTLTISGKGVMQSYTNYTETPWADYRSGITRVVVQGGVENIGAYAFGGTDGALQEIEIQEGVQRIEKQAFRTSYYDGKTLTIPTTVISIDEEAFGNTYPGAYEVAAGNPMYQSIDGVLYTADMKTLVAYAATEPVESYDIPYGVEVIGKYAFYNRNIKDVHFPDTLRVISDEAFRASKLENLTITSDHLESIGANAFHALWDSYFLTKIHIDAPNAVLHESAFSGQKNISQAYLNVKEIGPTVFVGAIGSVTPCDLEFGPAVEKIGANAFQGCNLTGFTLPSGLRILENNTKLSTSQFTDTSEFVFPSSLESYPYVSNQTDQLEIIRYEGNHPEASKGFIYWNATVRTQDSHYRTQLILPNIVLTSSDSPNQTAAIVKNPNLEVLDLTHATKGEENVKVNLSNNALDFSGGINEETLRHLMVDLGFPLQSGQMENYLSISNQQIKLKLDPKSVSQTIYSIPTDTMDNPAAYLQSVAPILRTYSGTDITSLINTTGDDWRNELADGEIVTPKKWLSSSVLIDGENRTPKEITAMLQPVVSGPGGATSFTNTVGTWTFTWTIGTQTITKTMMILDEKTDMKPVSFDNPEVQEGKVSITFGDSLQLKAKVDGTSITDLPGQWIWQSSDNSIATVDANGLISTKKAGTVTISVTETQNSTAYGNVEVKITPKEVTVSLKDTQADYSGTPILPELSYTGTVDGVLPEVTLSWEKEGIPVSAMVDAGTYIAVLAPEGLQDDHYTYQMDTGKNVFVVNPAAPSLIIADRTFVFNGTMRSLPVYGAGSKDAVITFNGEETLPVYAGAYEVIVTPTDPNYLPIPKTATLIIHKAPLAISLTAQKLAEGDAVVGDTVRLTATVTGILANAASATGKIQFRIDGQPVGDPFDPTSVDMSYDWTSTAGQHTFSASYLPAEIGENYFAEDAVLENYDVLKKDQPAMHIAAIPEKTMGEPDFALQITGGEASIPIEYEVKGDAVRIVDGKVHLVQPGTATVIATKPGNDVYNTAFAQVSITVQDPAAVVIVRSNLPDGRFLVVKDVTEEQKAALQAQIDGGYEVKFRDHTIMMLDIQLLDNAGNQIHDEAVTFTIVYPDEINSSNYKDYYFSVLHLNNHGPEILSYTADEEGLTLTTTLSPFAIGYDKLRFSSGGGIHKIDIDDISSTDETSGAESSGTDETSGAESSGTDETSGAESSGTDETSGAESGGTDETSGAESSSTGETSSAESSSTDKTGGETPQNPQTGDMAPVILWLLLFGVGFSGTATIYLRIRKYR